MFAAPTPAPCDNAAADSMSNLEVNGTSCFQTAAGGVIAAAQAAKSAAAQAAKSAAAQAAPSSLAPAGRQTSQLIERASNLQDNIIKSRRFFHRYPELGFAEFTAARTAAQVFERNGYNVRTGLAETGLTAQIGSGPLVAIKTEMDAYPVQELNRLEWRSVFGGISHACGHDAHLAVALAASALLCDFEAPGGTRIIVQPGEDAKPQAKKYAADRMIEHDVLEDVTAIIGFHVDSTMPAGRFAVVIDSDILDQNSRFRVVVSRSDRTQCADVLKIGTALSGELYRLSDLLGTSGKIQISSINSTDAKRVPLAVSIEGTLEGSAFQSLKSAESLFGECIAAVAADGVQIGLTVNLKQDKMQADASSDAQATLLDSAFELAGHENVSLIRRPAWTRQFNIYTDYVPGAFLMVGCKLNGVPRCHRSQTFDIDESNLYMASAILADCSLRLRRLVSA